MKAVILAAGSGTRMGKYGKSMPKGMLNFEGKPLLRWQIDALYEGGVEQVFIVSGYRKECINFKDVEYFHNPYFASTNMIESLMYARSILKENIIVAYADILYTAEIIRKMISVDDDIAVAVDDAWKSYWKLRYGTVNYDIESLTIGKKGRITNLGRPLISAAELDYRFIGLLRFTTAGCQQLLNVYDEHKKENTSWAQSGKPFKQGFMTDWLDEAIQKGVKIMPHITHHGWLEFDTAEDYELALGLKRKGLLNQFIQLELEQ